MTSFRALRTLRGWLTRLAGGPRRVAALLGGLLVRLARYARRWGTKRCLRLMLM